jgi:hypothetical protein
MKGFFTGRPWFRMPDFRGWGTRYRGMQGTRYCPDAGEQVLYSDCLGCPKYGVWEEWDLERCRYEYQERKEKGLYAKSQEEWEEYLHDLDPETWREAIEERRTRERVLAEMEAEKAERSAGTQAQNADQPDEQRSAHKNGGCEGGEASADKDEEEKDDEEDDEEEPGDDWDDGDDEDEEDEDYEDEDDDEQENDDW